MSVVWLGGELVDGDTARISPFDHGLLVGDGVFETLRVYGGTPFGWRRHHERLVHSASGLGLEAPAGDVLRAAAEAVLDANGLSDARLRITITGGVAPLGSERGEHGPTVVVAATALTPPPPTARVVVVPWTRNERSAVAGFKTISYADNVRALAYAAGRGASEAIFGNTRDELCEGTGSNVFVVNEGIVGTPPASSGCLLGVTRALVIELCTTLGIPVLETPIELATWSNADEAFLTSTTRQVQAIAAVGDDRVFDPCPGEITARLAAAFDELVASDLDP